MKSGAIVKSLISTAGVAALTVFLLGTWLVAYPGAAGVIPHGVKIAGIPVQGLTREQALKKLSATDRFTPPKILHLRAGDRRFEIDINELNYHFELEEYVNKARHYGRGGAMKLIAARIGAYFKSPELRVRAVYDKQAAEQLVELIQKKVECKPRDAKIDWAKFEVKPHVNGHRLDKKKSLEKLDKALAWYNGTAVKLAVEVTQAEVTTEDLDTVDFDKPLSTFSTNYNERTVGRSKNLKRISEILTGYEVKPGETFSYNEAVGERTKENGFFLAPEINAGRMVMNYGGGACQGSTTLFNTALLAGMDKFEWMPHSRRSHYADPGRDATVYFGKIDMKFHNPLKQSVYIYSTSEDGVMTFTMYSSFKPDYKVKLRSSWWGAWWPGTQRKVVRGLAPGEEKVISKGAMGMRAALWRKFIYDDGREREERMKNEQGEVLIYRGAPKVVHVGAGG